MLLESVHGTQRKQICVRMTEDEAARLTDVVWKRNLLNKQEDRHARPLSQNEFCRQAIFAACDVVEGEV